MKQLLLTLAIVNFSVLGMLAQKPQEREVKFKYLQLPLNPLGESISSYDSELVLDYKEEIETIISDAEAAHAKRIGRIPKDLDDATKIYEIEMEMYEKELIIAEDQYQRALVQHEKDKKSAEEEHEKKVADWKDSGVLNKLENSKPALRYPSRPYKRNPSVPSVKVPNEVPKFVLPQEAKAQKLFNEQQYADSYLQIEGFSNGAGGLNIKAIVYKMENLKVESKQEDTDPNPSVNKFMYWKEVEYKRPVSLNITDASGQIIFDGDVEGTSDFYLYTTEKSKSNSLSESELVENLHDISMEYSMQATVDFLNSMYGTAEVERNTKLFLIKDKKGVYTDYTSAFQTAMAGLNSLTYDHDAAMTKLKEASAAWESALAESDIMSKKARVDEKVTKATLYNLIEVNIWLGEFSKAEGYLNQLYSMKPTYVESIYLEDIINGYRNLILSERDRAKANS